MQIHTLIPHPDTQTAPEIRIEVSVSLTPNNGLTLTYTLSADPAQLRIPEPQAPTRADNLWRHTCFEAFIQGDDAPAYREFNFSPSGQWQVYAFTDTRQGGPMGQAPIPTLTRVDKANQLTLECLLPAEALPKGRLLRLGLTAVIESGDGSLSYWSLRHPPGKPDFHHTHAFVLTLDHL